MPLKKIDTDRAPKAIGPYSQAIVCGNFIFVSGQLPVDPAVGKITTHTISEQTTQVLKNIKAIIEAAGISLKNVVQTDVFLKNMSDFQEMNAIYAENFVHDPKPARKTIEVSRLPLDALVEISCVAVIPGEIQDLRFDKADALILSQAKPTSKQFNLNKLDDADGSQNQGCRQSQNQILNHERYIL